MIHGKFAPTIFLVFSVIFTLGDFGGKVRCFDPGLETLFGEGVFLPFKTTQ